MGEGGADGETRRAHGRPVPLPGAGRGRWRPNRGGRALRPDRRIQAGSARRQERRIRGGGRAPRSMQLGRRHLHSCRPSCDLERCGPGCRPPRRRAARRMLPAFLPTCSGFGGSFIALGNVCRIGLANVHLMGRNSDVCTPGLLWHTGDGSPSNSINTRRRLGSQCCRRPRSRSSRKCGIVS